MMASKSVPSTFLAMPSGYDHFFTNLEWIILSWSLSLSAKLDVVASGPRIAALTERSRRRLDFQYTLRQVNLRLEALVSPQQDSTGDRNVFYHFLKRARAIEAWYIRYTRLEVPPTPRSSDPALSNTGGATAPSTAVHPVLDLNSTESEHPSFGDLSFADYLPQDMQDMNFGIFLGREDLGLF
jgi:hypothetical protein